MIRSLSVHMHGWWAGVVIGGSSGCDKCILAIKVGVPPPPRQGWWMHCHDGILPSEPMRWSSYWFGSVYLALAFVLLCTPPLCCFYSHVLSIISHILGASASPFLQFGRVPMLCPDSLRAPSSSECIPVCFRHVHMCMSVAWVGVWHTWGWRWGVRVGWDVAVCGGLLPVMFHVQAMLIRRRPKQWVSWNVPGHQCAQVQPHYAHRGPSRSNAVHIHYIAPRPRLAEEEKDQVIFVASILL